MLNFWNIFYFADKKKKKSRSQPLLFNVWRKCEKSIHFYFYLIRYFGREEKKRSKKFFSFSRHCLTTYLRFLSNTLNPMEMEFYHYKAGSIWHVIAPGCCSVKHFFRKTVPVYFALTPFSFMKGLIISWSLNLPNQVLIVCFSDKHCMCPAKGSFCTNGETVGSQFCSWSFHEPDSCRQTGCICSQQPLLWLPS